MIPPDDRPAAPVTYAEVRKSGAVHTLTLWALIAWQAYAVYEALRIATVSSALMRKSDGFAALGVMRAAESRFVELIAVWIVVTAALAALVFATRGRKHLVPVVPVHSSPPSAPRRRRYGRMIASAVTVGAIIAVGLIVIGNRPTHHADDCYDPSVGCRARK